MKRIAIFLTVLLLSLQPFAQTGNGIFLANSFLAKSDVFTGIYPHSVVAADFNGDGKADLFISKGSSGNISVLTNISSPGTISFGTAKDFPGMSGDMQGTAVGDLDGDGKPDVVVANGVGDSSVSVFRNTSLSSGGSISFAAKIDFRTSYGPYSVAIGDLDGDGKPDLAIANTGANTITLYMNRSVPGTISFGKRMEITVGTNPYGIAVGDLDKDGKADLVVTTEGSSSSLYVLKNYSVTDSFSFAPPVVLSGLSGAFTVAIGDLNGDGYPDIAATGGYPNAILTIRNTSTAGNLSFEAAKNFETGYYMVDVSMHDLDGDGKPELLTANRFDNSVSVLKNKSTVSSIDFEQHVDYSVGEAPLIAAVADLDGDGRPDIITANSSSDKISILKNMIGDTLSPLIISFTPGTGINGTVVKITGKNFTGVTAVKFGGIEASSFTVDSASGITAVVGNGASGDLTVTTNFGTATDTGFIFKSPVIDHFNPTNGVAGDTIFIYGTNFTGVTGVSFGGTNASVFTIMSDSVIIAKLGNGTSGDLTIISPNGNASLPGFGYGSKPVIFSFTPSSGAPGSTVIISGQNFRASPESNIVYFGPVRAKVNTASATQLQVVVPAGTVYDQISVTTNQLTAYSSLPFLLNSADGDSLMSVNSFIAAGNFNTGDYPVAVSVSDLDQDGKPDLISANAVGNSISVLQNNSDAGNFSFLSKMDFPTAAGPRNIATGDLNGDGKPDIVVSDLNSGNESYVSVFENNSQQGAISFAPRMDIATGNGSVGVTIADINLDGKPDIIVTSGNSAIFSIFLNKSPGTGPLSFGPRMDFPDLNHAENIIAADLDNDGKTDIIFTEFSNSSVVIYRNTSVGGVVTLAAPVIYPVGTNPGFLRAGDLDGDGKPDLVVENYGSGTLTFYKNYSEPGKIQFGDRQDSVMPNASSIDIADLNGDGKPDLSLGQYQNGKLSIVQNSGKGSGISFSPAIQFSPGNFDVFGNVGDLNGDGRPDLIAANVLSNTITIFRNNGGAPVITSLSDTFGRKGETIGIRGKGFTGAIAVNFGGVPASSFQISSPTLILAVVDGGASGTVTVGTPTSTGTISGFRFIPQILYDGSAAFCKNTPFILQTTSQQNNQWYKDSLPISGATGNTLQLASGGYYFLKTTSNEITTSTDSGVQIDMINVPVPSITRSADNLLVSSIPAGNQWYLNGTVIPGATNATCIPYKNGLYTVTHMENGCTSDVSSAFNIELTEYIDLGNGQHVRLYPNPVISNLTMQWDINNLSSLNISISDLQGKPVLLKSDLQQKGATISLSDLSPGYYILKIYNPDSGINKSVKIFKAN